MLAVSPTDAGLGRAKPHSLLPSLALGLALSALACRGATLSAAESGEATSSPDRAALMTDYEPWRYWESHEGYPADRRLTRPVEVRGAQVPIASLLARASEQSGVRLRALEAQLSSQQLTVYASHLPLNALMVQVADLLGLYWYQRPTKQGEEYVVTYGSTPPAARAQESMDEAQRAFGQVRASRIAEYVRALALNDDELRLVGRQDPTLADTMLRGKEPRLVVTTISELPPAALRRLIDGGDVLVQGSQLPASYKDALRAGYADPAEAAGLAKIGIASEDALLDRYRLHLVAPPTVFEPRDQMAYDVYGPMWLGIHALEGVAIRTNSAAPDPGSDQRMPLILGQAGSWVLPGKLEDEERARALFPELMGADTAQSRMDAANKLIAAAAKEHQASESSSPFKDDPRLSQPVRFAIAAGMRVSDLLRAVADQTKCSVLGTYYEDQDHYVGAPLSEEPALYVLLNRAARQQGCSWVLQGNVIRWRHDEWFLLERKRQCPGEASPE